MKNLGIIAIMLLLNTAIFANPTYPTVDRSRVIVKELTSTSVMIRIINLEYRRASVDLKDESGQIVFTQNIKNKEGFVVNLDLSKLATGKYTVIVNRENSTYTQDLNIDANGNVFINERKDQKKPKMSQEKDHFKIANLNRDIISVSILDENGKALYEKLYQSREQSAESVKYDLRKVPKGEYQVQVKTSTTSYYFDLSV